MARNKKVDNLTFSLAPWTALKIVPTSKNNFQSVTVVDENNRDVLNCSHPRDKNNARLIAAAPELLEACKKMLEMIDNAEWTQAQRLACIYGARAAITKAE